MYLPSYIHGPILHIKSVYAITVHAVVGCLMEHANRITFYQKSSQEHKVTERVPKSPYVPKADLHIQCARFFVAGLHTDRVLAFKEEISFSIYG